MNDHNAMASNGNTASTGSRPFKRDPAGTILSVNGNRRVKERRRANQREDKARSALFAALRKTALDNVHVVDLTIPDLAARDHKSLAWDAAAMPAGGHYFPVFVELIAHFEQRYGVSPETHVLAETTTGTAGLALGYVAKKLGYDIVVFMPEDMPKRRIEAVTHALPSRTSELRLTPAGQYVKGMLRTFQKYLIESRGGNQATIQGKQYRRSLLPLNHSRQPLAVTAVREILQAAVKQVPSDRSIDYAVAALGNGTSSTALFDAVAEENRKTMKIGVEPIEAPTGFVQKYGEGEFERRFGRAPGFKQHDLLGTGGWGVNCPHLDVTAIDRIYPIDSSAWRKTQTTLSERGLTVGNSTAAVQSIIELLSESERSVPRTFFSIIYDTPEVY